MRPGLCKTAGLKLVYSPLNGSGLVPVTHVLNDMGVTDITVVPEQEYPNGYFTTCSYPNPEIFEALKLGLDLATKTGADLMLATDPDADRVGIAMKCPDGSYELVSGNEMGALLLDYICAGRIEKGTMPKDPVAVKSIVSTPLADAIAAHYGVEMRSVLTGFKWIGDRSQIWKLPVKWTASSSASRRATAIWPVLMSVTRMPSSAPCSSARWPLTTAASVPPSRSVWKRSTRNMAAT